VVAALQHGGEIGAPFLQVSKEGFIRRAEVIDIEQAKLLADFLRLRKLVEVSLEGTAFQRLAGEDEVELGERVAVEPVLVVEVSLILRLLSQGQSKLLSA
jgi:hypothetical protein